MLGMAKNGIDSACYDSSLLFNELQRVWLFADKFDLLENPVEAFAQVIELEMSTIVRICVFLALIISEVDAFVV